MLASDIRVEGRALIGTASGHPEGARPTASQDPNRRSWRMGGSSHRNAATSFPNFKAFGPNDHDTKGFWAILSLIGF